MGPPLSLLLLIPLLLVVSTVEGRYRCKDLNGKQVDWFVAYKLPTAVANANGGKNFVYADNNDPEWQLSRKPIDDPDSAIGATVSQAYGNDTSSFVLMYSDDGPVTPVDSYRGHAKGVLVFDGTTGFWLVHSVPNFPGMSSYVYPPTGFKFAQSFLCVSVATDNLAAIGEQLMFIQSSPFKSQLPDKFGTRFPILRTVLAKRSLPSSATVFTSTKHIQTEGGTQFHAYAKHKKFQKDLWHDLVAADQDVALGVQSWLNGGADDLHSTCGRDGNNVFDITDLTIMGANFSSSKDHSKWAVSDAARRPVVCVGDLNRQKSQLARGGGALCLEHAGIWRTYRGTVRDVEACMADWARGGGGEGQWEGGMKVLMYVAVMVLMR
ncbi:crn-7 [Pristionchus pacificus]|uniref:Crn-7 n=1 Tax=Pristionchus pacificus TaxID=54126 RepID=A0A2A6BFJ4_PRIPA|nr:crn-7 [Pristionchus pacificus]|eukprot:PDM64636.1 crn-7 [Pristionchus pacificus]